MKTALNGAELLFWSSLVVDTGDVRGKWLCLRESYFNFLLSTGLKPLHAMIQIMVDAQKVNGPV